MKKFYIFFSAGFILLSILLYLSIWWFLGGVAIIVILTIYHFYSARLKAMDASIEDLETQVDELQIQLDRSIFKEEKATKEAGQIRQIKQELLTIVSHEIRTPMNGVLGMSLLLADTPLTGEQKEYVDTIRKSGESLLGTVNEILVKDILDFSKLDGKNKKLERIDFELRDTIEEVLMMFVSKAGKNNTELLCDIDQNVPMQLLGDSKKLRKILMNLIENAVKFTHRGEVLIKVHLDEKNSGTDSVIIFEIQDSGVGISSQQMKQLFYDNTGSEFQNDTEQSGRGLIISRKLVELMNGTIEVKSKQDEGSTFTFTIPFQINSKATHNDLASDSLQKFEGKHVLVIDDSLASRSVLSKQLKNWKMIPLSAASGAEAMEIISQHSSFDLILMDNLALPFDSIQLGRAIKNKFPQTPVFLLNPSGNELDKQSITLFSGVITKPVRKHLLQDEILSVLNAGTTGNKTETENQEQNFSEQFPLKILIAEDNLINQKIAIKILTKLGYQPKVAANGELAFEMSMAEKFDIVLMDVQMPVMDGLEATRMIRSKLEVQPVIMAMTANVMQGDRDLCMQAGMDDYISKPIVLDELLSHLKKWSLAIKERNKK